MHAAPVYALARLAYSGGLVAAPARVAAGWLGPAAGHTSTAIALRGLAARDGALAAAVLVAAVTHRSPRVWLLLCAFGDLADIAATLSAPPDDLPANARTGTLALAGASALLGGGLALGSRGRSDR